MLTLPSPTPPPPPPPLLPPQILGMGSIGQNSTFFQNSINTNQQRHLYRDNMRGSMIFLSGGGGGGGGGGSRPLNLIYSLQRGPMDLVHIFQWGVQLFQWGVQMLISIETHVTCDFQVGLDPILGSGPPIPPSGSAHGQCGSLVRIGSGEPVWPPLKLRNYKC